MSLKHHSIAFLKANQIKYYVGNDELIYFQCHHCNNKAKMEHATSLWKCECGQTGNLGTLIQIYKKCNDSEKTIEKQISKKLFINPKHEKYEINYLLNKLISSIDNKELVKACIKIQGKFDLLCKEFNL